MIIGVEGWEDAGVYKLTDDLAIVQTVDYFTPIVDDPYDFGRIAAANALSDIYAKGGKPLTAMNLVCFPSKTMDLAILKKILRGAMEKIEEAGAALVGGHSVEDPELKFGLSVTGIIHPDRVVRNTGAHPGDGLVLTKPLGTGVINTAIKAGMADAGTITAVSDLMASLNRPASEAMMRIGVHACTDITGFGFLGHACEMIQGMPFGFEIEASAVPVMPPAIRFAQMGLIPGGTYRNREFRAGMVDFASNVPRWVPDILFDPQTSGGLLIALSPEKTDSFLAAVHPAGCPEAAWVGRVSAEIPGKIIVR